MGKYIFLTIATTLGGGAAELLIFLNKVDK